MLISKFNKLIRSKVLWTILALIIAFFFVGSSVISKSGCGRSEPERTAEGILFGKEVSGNDFYIARFFEMGMRPMTDNSDEAIAALRERTWQRLAALHMAEDLGISVTDDEVRALIMQDPTFNVNGAFSQQRYLAFLQNQLGLDPGTFEDYLRQDMILRRLMAALSTATWTTPYELTQRLTKLTDQVAMEYAMVPPMVDTHNTSVSDEAVTNYFETYRDAFRIDEQRKVRYVAFPITNYLAKVSLSESDIDSYYEDHIDDYTSTDTNGTETVVPVDELHDDIAAIVREQQAQFEAKDDATRFVMSLAPDRYGQALDMEAAAAQRNLPLLTSAWFTVSDVIPGLEDAGTAAASTAFELVASDPERYFSDAISGTNAIYVIAEQDSRPARDPELEEVRAQVKLAAMHKAAEEAYEANLQTTRDALAAAAADTNQSFIVTAQEMGLTTATTGVFTVYEGLPTDIPYSATLIAEIIDAAAGDVLPPATTENGALIAHITARDPGDPSATELLRPQFIRTMDQYLSAALYADWLDQMMAQGSFKDYHPITE